jgi:NhaC family Na+:H+ antiporter
MDTDSSEKSIREPPAIREPSLVDALIPLLFMIALLAASIVLFGLDAALGPLQVALLMSAVVAGVVAHKNGHSWEVLGQEMVKGISLAMSAIMILLMVGALIGVWNMSGTMPRWSITASNTSIHPGFTLQRRCCADSWGS